MGYRYILKRRWRRVILDKFGDNELFLNGNQFHHLFLDDDNVDGDERKLNGYGRCAACHGRLRHRR